MTTKGEATSEKKELHLPCETGAVCVIDSTYPNLAAISGERDTGLAKYQGGRKVRRHCSYVSRVTAETGLNSCAADCHKDKMDDVSRPMLASNRLEDDSSTAIFHFADCVAL